MSTGWHMHGGSGLWVHRDGAPCTNPHYPRLVLDPADPALRERIAREVDRHEWEPTVVNARYPFRAGCSCGWISEPQGGGEAHSAHVADAVLAALAEPQEDA